MKTSDFRKELLKAMPGYRWTLHQIQPEYRGAYLAATGVQTSGYNRLSTLSVTRSEKDGKVIYTAKSAGFGKRAPWLSSNSDGTLFRALRGLQNSYENVASNYRKHANDLKVGRVLKGAAE